MKIKNANYICPKMQLRDIKEAFDAKTPIVTAYELIGEGYISKISERYYKPTEKLWIEITPHAITLNDHQKRYLANNSSFYWKDLETIFGSDLIPKAFLRMGYIRLEDNKRYKKSEILENFLLEGEEVIRLK